MLNRIRDEWVFGCQTMSPRSNALKHGLALFALLCLSIVSTQAQLQQLAQIERHQYTEEDHKGGTQTWDIQHLPGGHSFFANNDGLLHFDGVQWELYKTPLRTICRSIEFHAGDSLLYVGSQGEFGYFDLTEYPLNYTSLLDRIPSGYRKFSDVWDMVIHNEELYFWSDQSIYKYNGDSCVVYPLESKISFMSTVDNKIVFNQRDSELYTLENDVIKPLETSLGRESIKWMDIVDLPGEGHLLLSEKAGIYQHTPKGYRRWQTNSEEILGKSMLRMGYHWQEKNLIGIATFLSGVLLFDEHGVLRYRLSQENGLSNNTISALSGDEQNKLWVASFIDIAQVTLDRTPATLYPDGHLKGAVYDVAYWHGYYYFATSNGLYALKDQTHYDPGKQAFFAVPGTEGECWGLDIVGDKLFLAHNRGGFRVVNKGQVIQFYDATGVWKHLPVTDRIMAMGAYDGIHLFEKKDDQWIYWRKVPSLSVSSRVLVSLGNSELWMSHPYMGLFRILWSEDFSEQQLIPPEDISGISEISNCYAFKFEDQLIVTSAGQLYAFSHDRDSFILDEHLNDLFENEDLVRLIPEDDHHFYISDQYAGILQKEQLGTSMEYRKKQLFPTKGLFIGGFENLVSLKERFFICSDRGVIIRRPDSQQVLADLKLQRIQHQDSVLHSSLLTNDISHLNLRHDMRELKLTLAVLGKNILSEDLKLHSVFHKKNKDWSIELEGTTVHLQNLSPGKYVLDCQVSYENKVVEYPAFLEIELPYPWYWSGVARAAYVFLLLMALALLGYWPAYRERNDKKKLLIENKKMDSQMQQLQAEKDRLELRAMEKELANSTMQLLQKRELLNGLRREIENVSGRVKDPVAKKELRFIENKLKDDKRLQEDWENFTKHFNRIHNDFIRRLKNQYPHLTPNDLKLCAYLRLNLRTKEIAPLLGISVRGVEVSRYRLRKKLDLDTDTNLNDYMISY